VRGSGSGPSTAGHRPHLADDAARAFDLPRDRIVIVGAHIDV
jgi:hypothetical protein